MVTARNSTRYCTYCDNTGIEMYVIDGVHSYSRCPDCVNLERGIPIPWSELGVSDERILVSRK